MITSNFQLSTNTELSTYANKPHELLGAIQKIEIAYASNKN